MAWLTANAEVLALGLALIVAIAGGVSWIIRRKDQSPIHQRSGDNSMNVVSGRDVNIHKPPEEK